MDRYRDILEVINLPADEYLLNEMLSNYPWFTTARILRDMYREEKDNDPFLEHYLLSHPLPLPLLYNITPDDFKMDIEVDKDIERKGGTELIDKFLSHEGKYVQPKDDTPEENVSERSNILELTDDYATEELAEIFMKQGLVEQAEEIYRKLGKKPPPQEP